MLTKRFLLVVFMLSSMAAFAQENETLFGTDGGYTHSGYGAVEVKFGSVMDEFAVFTGGKGAWVINNTLLLGGGGYGLVSQHKIDGYVPKDGLPADIQLYNGYGGFIIGYINNQKKLVHYSAELLIGAGGANYSLPYEEWDDNQRLYNYEDTYFFVLEPSLYLEINLTSFMVAGIGASYRFTNGADMSKTKDSDLSGFSGNIVFKFGKF